MSRRKKQILFYSAIIVFLILSYVVLLYAQGYKYSFSEGKFLRTGAITIRVNTDANVFLDDELDGNTSFFNNSYSIDRLLPGTYKLRVQKDDYAFWQKTVTVEEGFVVSFPSIIILPEEGEEEQELFDEVGLLFEEFIPASTSYVLDEKTNILYKDTGTEDSPKLEEIARNVKGFRVSADESRILWWSTNELWVMWLRDTNYQPFYKAGDKELITRFSTTIHNALWFRGDDHIVYEIDHYDTKGRPYSIFQVIEIDKRGGVNIIEL